jgi:hypothetical protein
VIVAKDFQPRASNSLRGFITLQFIPSGLALRDCTLHEKDGRRWIGLPAKPQIDSEGRVRKDLTTGKTLYTPVIEIPGKAERERFQQAALAAVDRLLGAGEVSR